MAEKVSCCPSSAIVAVSDYGTGVGGAKPFLQRIGALNAMAPGSRASLDASRVHTIPLKEPLPLPELQTPLLGELPPDKGKSLDWPYPDYEREEQEG